jgi:hypothetical protein
VWGRNPHKLSKPPPQMMHNRSTVPNLVCASSLPTIFSLNKHKSLSLKSNSTYPFDLLLINKCPYAPHCIQKFEKMACS